MMWRFYLNISKSVRIQPLLVEHVVAFPFEKGKLDEINPCFFVDFQERGVFHIFEDSFSNMLQPSESMKIAML